MSTHVWAPCVFVDSRRIQLEVIVDCEASGEWSLNQGVHDGVDRGGDVGVSSGLGEGDGRAVNALGWASSGDAGSRGVWGTRGSGGTSVGEEDPD